MPYVPCSFVPPKFCSGRLFVRCAEVRLIQNFTRGKENRLMEGVAIRSQASRYFELVLECDPQRRQGPITMATSAFDKDNSDA